MKEFVEKLIGRLEEYKDTHLIEHDSEECLHCSENEDDWCNCRDCFICVWDKAKAIVKELAEEYKNDCCEWKFTKSVIDSGYFYSSGCNHKRFYDLHSFEFCPYCGKKIKVVK